MYKDRDKQRQAVKEAVRRYRAKNRDGALLAQKQPLENAPGRPTIDELSNTHLVIPSECNTQSYNPMMVGYVPPK